MTLVSSEASQRCGLSPGAEYTLIVAPIELQLKQPESQEILFKWPYRLFYYVNSIVTSLALLRNLLSLFELLLFLCC